MYIQLGDTLGVPGVLDFEANVKGREISVDPNAERTRFATKSMLPAFMKNPLVLAAGAVAVFFVIAGGTALGRRR